MDNQIDMPAHGWITCTKCFTSGSRSMETGDWRAINDPAAWGSKRPKILVLGFSKGFTQSNASLSTAFDDIPFKGMRPRLSETLGALGILKPGEDVSRRIVASEKDLAFGSLVRCSLSRYNGGKKRYECTGTIMPKAFKECIAPVVQSCAETFLSDLPNSLKCVLLLGTGDSYVEGCRKLVQRLHSATFVALNDVAYQTGEIRWVHVSHPSGLNGHHPAWIVGDPNTKQGLKFQLAKSVMRQVLGD